MDFKLLGLFLGAYLLGAVPFGLLVARAFGGPDPRTAGSKNIGANNVARLVGKSAGLLTLFLDAGKGAAPTALALACLSPWQAVLVGLAAFIGHIWPVFLGFKGGKGVATAIGVILAFSPGALAGVLAVFFLTAWWSGYVSVGSMAACASAPIWLFLAGRPWVMVAASLLMALVVVWRHRENIARLRAGQEHGLP
jgi:glycerol-3-phosphate acyltransferase PlsY